MTDPAFDPQQFIRELQNSPVFWVIISVIGFSIVATFVWPVIKKIYSLFPKIVDQLKTNPEVPGEVKKNNKLFKKQFIQVAGVILVLVSLGFGGWVYFQSRPETISARTFVKREAKNIDYIEQNDAYLVYLNSDLYLIDLRTKEQFRDRHIKSSFNVQLQRVDRNVSFSSNRKIALYSSLDDIETVRKAASVLDKNTSAKIYIIEDGYEGLKNQGLETSVGTSFGGEYFEWK